MRLTQNAVKELVVESLGPPLAHDITVIRHDQRPLLPPQRHTRIRRRIRLMHIDDVVLVAVKLPEERRTQWCREHLAQACSPGDTDAVEFLLLRSERSVGDQTCDARPPGDEAFREHLDDPLDASANRIVVLAYLKDSDRKASL